jgi:hypothetical protein
LKDKQRCKWHGGKSTGPKTAEGMAETVSAMWWGRKHKIERLHKLGLRAPGGRPPRIPDWLRRAVIQEAEKELAGLDLETVLTAEPAFEDMTEREQLADLDQYGLAMLIQVLRPRVGSKNRSRTAIGVAWNLAETRYVRVERGESRRSRLDELIEEVAIS